ncbi:MAG: hypothetical protein OQK11_06500 [Thiovulaceae bacterium]|nr:hypothetical protein [Sulfurimonadaceae bacterium]
MRLIFFFTFLTTILLQAYEIGRGYKLHDALHLGGYFSTDYSNTKEKSLFRLDDVALLAYGNLNNELSYLIEMEAAPFYTYEYKTEKETKDTYFHKERLYLDYKYSESINLRIGKQITPIGYWNLEPINVLRETSSNPILSSEMFPKFLSGIDIYGYIPSFDSISYHMFGQKNKDLDEEYINIKNKHFFGLSIENESNFDFLYGGSIGEFISEDNKRSRYLSFNLKHDVGLLNTQAEAVISNIHDNNTNKSDYKIATYIQPIYRINSQNSIVARYEYFKDNALNIKRNLGLLGYSYRPVYSVSFKGEYQIHSNSNLNKFIISFSVLF